jgi:hypothetical protein
MDSKLRKKLVDVHESTSLFYEPHEKFGIEREEVRRVDAAAFFVGVSGPEDSRLLQVESAVQITHRCKRGLPALPNMTSIGIDPPGIAEYDIGFPGLEGLCHGMQCSRRVQIVGI